jgi:hypothetical protein
MSTTTTQLVAGMRSIQGFLAAAPDLAEGLETVQRRFDDALALVTSLSAAQAEHSRAALAAPAHLNALREQLRMDHMRPIVAIAARHDLPMPAMPAADVRPADLVSTAYAMSTAAERCAETYIAFGLPVDFAERLRYAASAVAALIEERNQRNAARTATTRALLQATAEARLMITLIDARIRPRVRGNSLLLEAWSTVARSRARPRAAGFSQ